MNHLITCCLPALFVGAVFPSQVQAQKETSGELTHTREAFAFTVSAPQVEVFPLFGAYEERTWAHGFDPQFLHPVPAYDQPGMVFTTVQAGLPRVWTNTCFDAGTGHVQYVYWIADVMVAFIDIWVNNAGPHQTEVGVVYERTALRPEANEMVSRMAHDDAHSGPHWAEAINGYLRGRTVR